jgi:hypothetical protein
MNVKALLIFVVFKHFDVWPIKKDCCVRGFLAGGHELSVVEESSFVLSGCQFVSSCKIVLLHG